MKQIKDPIYEYVDIDDDFTKVIDMPEYQRLRNVIQTSYQALYPSALHNRFTHSIGVFHLGRKLFASFCKNVKSDFPLFYHGDWKRLEKTFLLACLLHDVGHSPFSHTGEKFYKDNHPSILYDAKLVDLAIASYDSFMKKKYKDALTEKTVFTQKALSLEGYIGQGVPLSLLSDEDIITYLKNGEDQSAEAVWLRKQYFDRSERLKPLWKSESEFSHLEREILGTAIRRSFKAALKAISGYAFFINESEMEKAVEQKKLMEEAALSEDEDLKNAAQTSLQAQEAVIRIFHIFNQFRLDMDLDFKFAFLFVEHHYESNYSKLQNSDIYIEFSKNRVIPFRDVLTVAAVQASEDEKNGYYYIFSSRKNIERMQEKGLDFGREILMYISRNWITL